VFTGEPLKSPAALRRLPPYNIRALAVISASLRAGPFGFRRRKAWVKAVDFKGDGAA
jgi:hypothetical protein